jgi:hypothetical protein
MTNWHTIASTANAKAFLRFEVSNGPWKFSGTIPPRF